MFSELEESDLGLGTVEHYSGDIMSISDPYRAVPTFWKVSSNEPPNKMTIGLPQAGNWCCSFCKKPSKVCYPREHRRSDPTYRVCSCKDAMEKGMSLKDCDAGKGPPKTYQKKTEIPKEIQLLRELCSKRNHVSLKTGKAEWIDEGGFMFSILQCKTCGTRVADY